MQLEARYAATAHSYVSAHHWLQHTYRLQTESRDITLSLDFREVGKVGCVA